MGIDSLTVVNHSGRLLDRFVCDHPLCLVEDADLIRLIHGMMLTWGMRTVRVSKVKGHATDLMAGKIPG